MAKTRREKARTYYYLPWVSTNGSVHQGWVAGLWALHGKVTLVPLSYTPAPSYCRRRRLLDHL